MKDIAKHLLDIKAVFLRPNNPFTWSSGIKSPIYCDNRLTLSYPKVRKDIENALASLIKAKFASVDVIMGTATAGIAHAALVAEILELPTGYVRGLAKKHGRTNQIEGVLKPGQNVVVVEDLISTGGSSIEVVKKLEEAGANVLGVVAIFTYKMEKADTNFVEANVPYYAITDYDELIDVALENDYISAQDVSKLKSWKNDPTNEDWMK